MGFYTPQLQMLQGDLRTHLEEALADDGLNAPLINRGRVQAVKRRFLDGNLSDADALWRLWMLVIWSREFDVSLA